MAPEQRLILLSDVSQSLGKEDEVYPEVDAVVRLTEVVRCSKRIVQAAATFQLGEKKIDTQCHHESIGPPLKSFLFDLDAGASEEVRYKAYAGKVLEAWPRSCATFRACPGALRLQDQSPSRARRAFLRACALLAEAMRESSDRRFLSSTRARRPRSLGQG